VGLVLAIAHERSLPAERDALQQVSPDETQRTRNLIPLRSRREARKSPTIGVITPVAYERLESTLTPRGAQLS
jgi:hypothetical protein